MGAGARLEPIEVRLSGSGGQGLQLSARILAEALVLEGRSVAQSQHFEPTSRGGVSRSDLVIGDGPIAYPLVTALDRLLVLDQIAVAVSAHLLKSGASVLVDSARVPSPPAGEVSVCALPLCETARALGNERVANVVALGALAGAGGLCTESALERAVRALVPRKFLDLNLEALAAGRRLAS
jgi:2-oxoglutarate ferredoxin oxidoreductase subunit gamma